MTRPSANRRQTGSPLHVGYCPACGKRRYPSKHAARKAARNAHPGEPMNAYPCLDDYWHIGHPHATRKRRAR